MHYAKSMKKIVKLLKPGGMFVFSCSAPGMEEHGTLRTTPQNSPMTIGLQNEWSTYYANISEADFRKVLELNEIFSEYMVDEHHELKVNPFRSINDLYFWGIKK